VSGLGAHLVGMQNDLVRTRLLAGVRHNRALEWPVDGMSPAFFLSSVKPALIRSVLFLSDRGIEEYPDS
jgi:hypothetical protein